MAVRFKRVFGLYTFFSVFLPGAMFLLGIVPLANFVSTDLTDTSLVVEAADSYLVTLLGVLVFVTLGMFVGFVLHSLGALFEKEIGGFRFLPAAVEDLLGFDFDWMAARVGRQHRELFHEMLNGQYQATHADLVSSTVETINGQFSRLDLHPEAPQEQPVGDEEDRQSPADEVASSRAANGEIESRPDGGEEDASADDEAERDVQISEGEADAMYALVRSRIHMDKTGRSRTFQAVIASCRSMLVAWFVLTFLYAFLLGGMVLVQLGWTADTLPLPELLQQLVSWLWIPEAEPPSLENLTRAFLAVVITGFVGAYGLAGVVRTNKQYYLEYLVSDYLLLHRESDDESDERSERTTTRP